MASPRLIVSRILRSNVCRQCEATLVRQTASPIITRSFAPATRTLRPAFASVRWHSAPTERSKVYDYSQMRSLTDTPSSERIIIDVREPSEYAAGYIPGAINIPVKSQPDAIFLSEDEFEDRFGFAKPDPEKEVVFYCRSGVRSSAAAQLAQQQGYANIAEYRGSWLDWEKNGGAVETA